MQTLYIDNEAKVRIYLKKVFDKDQQPYFIGKAQWPGTLDFEEGASFMVFLSEEGSEEIQIGPLDPNRLRNNNRSGPGVRGGKICIELHPFTDQNGHTFYVGEALGPAKIQLRQGIFFTVFTSRQGYEEMQIGRLQPHKFVEDGAKPYKRQFPSDNDQDERMSVQRERGGEAPKFTRGYRVIGP